MKTFRDDVWEQPQVLEEVVHFYGNPQGRALLAHAARMSEDRTRPVILTGMGSSFCAARAAAFYLWSLGLPAWYVEASELLHYGLPSLLQEPLLIMVSQSGESAEIVGLLDKLPKDAVTIGITNQATSSLGREAGLVLPLLAGEESATASKTYTASLAVVFLASAALSHGDLDAAGRGILGAAERLSQLGEKSPSLGYDVLAGWLAQAKAVALLGRGSGTATAMEGALTLKEMTKIPAEAMEAAQFRHGPLEIAGPDLTAVVFASPGKTERLLRAFALELAQFGTRVAVVCNGELMEAGSPTKSSCSKWDEVFYTLTDIFPVQMVADAVTTMLGRAGFRRISKVTDKE